MKITSRPLLLALAAATLAASLSACAPLIIGGAAVGAIMAFDRRTSGAQLEDEGIELRGASALRQTVGERGHVNITSYNRQVLLTGEVPNEQLKQAAEQALAKVDNVKGIVNDIAVMPNTSLAQRSNDTLITGKVKASLVDDRTLYVGAFKVVTERGVVYLMGRVTQREAERATQIARNIGGVQRVVRIFEIITDEEVRRMQPNLGGSAPAPARAPAPASSVTPAPTSSVAPAATSPVAPAPTSTVGPAARPSSVTPTPLPPAAPTPSR
jgi:osmotically-inducible protein OsmY